MPSASSCLLHVFCFAENPYQTRYFFWNICDFWEKESTRDDARGARKLKGRTPYPGCAWQACGHPVGRLEVYFSRKEAYIQIKIMLKFQPNQSYEPPDI